MLRTIASKRRVQRRRGRTPSTCRGAAQAARTPLPPVAPSPDTSARSRRAVGTGRGDRAPVDDAGDAGELEHGWPRTSVAPTPTNGTSAQPRRAVHSRVDVDPSRRELSPDSSCAGRSHARASRRSRGRFDPRTANTSSCRRVKVLASRSTSSAPAKRARPAAAPAPTPGRDSGPRRSTPRRRRRARCRRSRAARSTRPTSPAPRSRARGSKRVDVVRARGLLGEHVREQAAGGAQPGAGLGEDELAAAEPPAIATTLNPAAPPPATSAAARGRRPACTVTSSTRGPSAP